MAQKKAGVDEIEASEVEWRVGDVCNAIINVVNVLSGSFCAANLQLGGVHIETDDSARRTYSPGELSRNVTSTTPHIEAHHSRANAYPI
jgi:hypothetical protein